MFELLKQLCEIPGPAGNEARVQRFLAERWRGRAREVRITDVGNLIAHVGGRGDGLLLVAHADEIGHVVKSITPDGFLAIAHGGRDLTGRPPLRGGLMTPLGQAELVVGDGDVLEEGIYTSVTGHITTPNQREQTRLEWNDLLVDIGATSRDDVLARGVRVGSRVIWNPPTRRKGPLMWGKAMDDRAPLLVLDQLLERVDPDRLQFDLWLGSSVMEEIGLVGAASINREIGSRYGVAIDVGPTGDYPLVDDRDVPVKLGGGPILVHKDTMHYNRRIMRGLQAAAEAAGVPYQDAIYSQYGSDAGELMRQGTAAGLLCIPTRYTHSPHEMVHERDLEQTIALLEAFVTRPLPE